MSKVNQPLVSVIVPCYNHEKYVEQTIESIVNQTYKNIELIVIDDGSKDSSPEILEKLSKKYNFYFERQENMGLPATLNKMIKMAQGEYISLIASDDVKTLDKIEILVNEFIQLSDEYAVVFGEAKIIDDNGIEKCVNYDNEVVCEFIKQQLLKRPEIDFKKNFGSYNTLLIDNYLPAMTTLIRKKVIIEAGYYDEDISIEDWSMWLKIARKYKFKYVDSIVAYYRLHDSNSIYTMSEKLNMDKLRVYAREKQFCFDHNLATLWERLYYSKFIDMLLEKKYMSFAENMPLKNSVGFMLYVSKRLFHKLSRR